MVQKFKLVERMEEGTIAKIFFLIGVFLSGMVAGYFYFYYPVMSDLEFLIEYYQDKYLFDRIAKHLAEEHNYTKDYVCANFTKELVHRLREAGYDAYYTIVRFKNCENMPVMFNETRSCFHAVTRFCTYIESQTGELIPPEHFKEKFDIINIEE